MFQRPEEGIAKIQSSNWVAHFLLLFFLCFPLSLPFTVSLDHALQNSLHDLREGRKKRRKVGQADLFFFPTVHKCRGWRCYRQLDEEKGLMGRQGLVARRSHSELGQRQRLHLVNGLSYWGEKLQMNHRLYAPSWALRSLLSPQRYTSKNTHTYKCYSCVGVSEVLPPLISSSLPFQSPVIAFDYCSQTRKTQRPSYTHF